MSASLRQLQKKSSLSEIENRLLEKANEKPHEKVRWANEGGWKEGGEAAKILCYQFCWNGYVYQQGHFDMLFAKDIQPGLIQQARALELDKMVEAKFRTWY